MTKQQHYEIGIIGAGLVGSLAALLLAKMGYSVALIDPKKSLKIEKTPGLRVSAVTPASLNLLEESGVLAKLDKERFSKILAMRIDEVDSDPIQFFASEVGRDQLGFIVENDVLHGAIKALFPEQVHPIATKCDAIRRIHEGFQLSLNENTEIQVDFLILAQGNESVLAQSLGIPFEIFDYHEEALVFHVESEKPHQQIAYQRFLSSGPVAFLPLYQENWSSIVWTLPKIKAQAFKKLSQTELAEKLEQEFPLLGKLKIISAIASFPMYAQQARKVAGNRFVLLGDAAHTVHPLAGQGVNLGFRDAMVLAKTFKKAKIRHLPLSAPWITETYAERTLKYNRLMTRSFSVIHYFYTPSALSKLRQLGAKYLNRIIPLKKELMKIAMGERWTP